MTNKENIKVGFLTATNPLDRRESSGVHFKMFHALKEEFEEVLILGPVTMNRFILNTLKVVGFLHLRFFGKKHNSWQNILLAKFYARQFQKKLKKLKIDVIYAPKASTEIAYLKTEIPIIYATDTTFDQINNYYHHYSGFSKLAEWESNLIEQRAIQNAKHLVFPSTWAANHVVKFYKTNSAQISIVKHGANIIEIPNKSKLDRIYDGVINVLFLGKEWERKGGDIAFDAFENLINQGYQISFTVCGCIPPVKHPKMKVISFLNKNNEIEKKIFDDLLLSSHLMFMPTRAEAMGIAFCEAFAYGLPVISTNTGGVSAVVDNGINGYLLPIEATSKDYVIKIKQLFENKEKIKKMAKNAREKFEQELNWEAWRKGTKNIILNVANQ